MTHDDLVALALEWPDTEERLYYGSPGVKRSGRVMFVAAREGNQISLKLDWPTLERLLVDSPEVFYKTAHQEPWPWCLVRLDKLSKSLAATIVEASWADAPKPGKMRKPL